MIPQCGTVPSWWRFLSRGPSMSEWDLSPQSSSSRGWRLFRFLACNIIIIFIIIIINTIMNLRGTIISPSLYPSPYWFSSPCHFHCFSISHSSPPPRPHIPPFSSFPFFPLLSLYFPFPFLVTSYTFFLNQFSCLSSLSWSPFISFSLFFSFWFSFSLFLFSFLYFNLSSCFLLSSSVYSFYSALLPFSPPAFILLNK